MHVSRQKQTWLQYGHCTTDAATCIMEEVLTRGLSGGGGRSCCSSATARHATASATCTWSKGCGRINICQQAQASQKKSQLHCDAPMLQPFVPNRFYIGKQMLVAMIPKLQHKVASSSLEQAKTDSVNSAPLSQSLLKSWPRAILSQQWPYESQPGPLFNLLHKQSSIASPLPSPSISPEANVGPHHCSYRWRKCCICE